MGVCSDSNRGTRGGGRVITYSVWVGGSEVNAYYLSRESAERIAKAWQDSGYDDAAVEEVNA